MSHSQGTVNPSTLQVHKDISFQKQANKFPWRGNLQFEVILRNDFIVLYYGILYKIIY